MKVAGQKPAKDVQGDTETFVDFARRLMQVPHSEIKAEMDAERDARERRKSPKSGPSSRASGVSPKRED